MRIFIGVEASFSHNIIVISPASASAEIYVQELLREMLVYDPSFLIIASIIMHVTRFQLMNFVKLLPRSFRSLPGALRLKPQQRAA